MACSGDHTEFTAAVETAATKAQEAMSEAEIAHRSALGFMATAEQRDVYLSAIKDTAMKARLTAFSASLEKAMDRKHDKEEKEKPSAEVAALMVKLNEFIAERDEAEVAAVSPLVSELANATDNPQASFETFRTFTPAQIRALHGMRFGQAEVASAARRVQAPARQGMEYRQVPVGQVPAGQVAVAGQVAAGQVPAGQVPVSSIQATIPSQGSLAEEGVETAGLVNQEWEVPI